MTPERFSQIKNIDSYDDAAIVSVHDEIVDALAASRASEERLREAIADLFLGEESSMWVDMGHTLACIDCGVVCTEDVSDIEHEDGCVIGPLFALYLEAAAAPPDAAPRGGREPER